MLFVLDGPQRKAILELLQFFRWFAVHLAEKGKTATRSVRDCY
jgi:hypothetical protein